MDRHGDCVYARERALHPVANGPLQVLQNFQRVRKDVGGLERQTAQCEGS